MNTATNQREGNALQTEPVAAEKETPKEEQQKSDPNITELKGLTDPKEDLEVKGTDNDL